MKMCHFRAQNAPLSWTNFFWHKTLLLLSTYWPFSFSEILKKFLQQIQSYEDVPFLDPKWSICDHPPPPPPPSQKKKKKNKNKKKFFGKLFHLLAPFIVQNLKNSSSGSRVMRMCNFWAQNGPFPKWEFFQTVNEPCFFHSCRSTCQKSKSDINLLLKYWWLNTEISLAKSHFWLKTRFFPGMQFLQNVNEPYELLFYTNFWQN